MLGPVSTPTNLYLSVQDTRVPAETRATERGPVPAGAEPYSSSPAGAIAGNLNIMLLSAPERMSQNLVVLTEVLAAVLKLKQEPDEPLTAFAARLIDAIATLAPAEQQKLKAMLSDAFAGLQLRTLLLALRNPQGPEAATLAIYLELYRQKERDPGARAVISSYRQNGGGALAPPLRDLRGTAQQLQPLATVPARLPAPSLTTGQTGKMAKEITAPSVKAASSITVAQDDLVYDAGILPKPSETGEASDSVNLRGLRQMRERLSVAADAAQAGRSVPLATDRTQPDSANPAAAVVSAQAEADQPSLAESSKAKEDASSNVHAGSPDAEPEDTAGAPAFQQPSPAAAAHLLEEVTETELIRTLLALYGPDADPDAVDLALETLMPSEPEELEAKPQSAGAASLLESAADDSDVPVPGRTLHLEEQLAMAPLIPVTDHAEPGRAGMRTDGLPLAFVSYFIESEDEIEPASFVRKGQQEDEQHDEQHDGAADEEHASGEGAAGDAPDENAEPEGPELEDTDLEGRSDLGLATPRLDATDVVPALSPPDTDPAQALYLRMSDFA
jgi:hypothetical protein